jgi:hypothetical protein
MVATEMFSTQVCSRLTLKNYTRLEGTNALAYLSCLSVIKNKFYTLAPGVKVIKLFSSRLMKRANKLDCLPLTRLSSLFGVMQEVFYKGEHLISAYVGPIRPGLKAGQCSSLFDLFISDEEKGL